MPVVRAAQSVVHQMHGTSFTSYASPARGSRELCAWRIEIPGGTDGVPHHVSREEVLYVLAGDRVGHHDGRVRRRPAGRILVHSPLDPLTGPPASTGP